MLTLVLVHFVPDDIVKEYFCENKKCFVSNQSEVVSSNPGQSDSIMNLIERYTFSFWAQALENLRAIFFSLKFDIFSTLNLSLRLLETLSLHLLFLLMCLLADNIHTRNTFCCVTLARGSIGNCSSVSCDQHISRLSPTGIYVYHKAY